MQEFGGKASKYAFSSALKSFGSKGSLRQGRTTHDHIIKSGHDTDVVIGTALVDMYAKCGSFEEARRAFDSCPHRDVVSWNAIISAYTDHGHGLLALDLFQKMQLNEGFLPNKVSFLLALKACAIEDIIWHGRLIHDHIIRSGIPLDEMFSSSLIDMYAKCGNLDDASAVFTNLPIKNVFSWGALMAGYAQHGLGFAALELFEKMRHDGVQPTPVIFSCILKACGSIGAIEQGRLVHDQIKENKLGLDPVISNALVDMYAKCGEFVEACKVLHELPYRSERSWGAIIGGYIQHGHFLSALQLFVKMQQEGRKANEVIYSCVLKACGSIGATNEGRIIHEQILRNKLESDVVVGNSIIDMYASFGSLIEARKIFDIFPKRNTGSWDAMIAGYTKHGHDAHALELFEKVQHDSLKPSEAMFSCVVKACGGLRVSVQGRSLHGQIVINLFIPDVVVVNSLIDMYLRCGSLEEARRVFDKSFNRDVVSWNSIIGGYVQSGHGLSALDLFHRMIQSGSKPDRVTYLCMVKACGTTGALRQGRFMHEQIVESGFESDVAVRISLVDMFARCGSLEEARKLLDGTARSDAGSWAAMIAGYAQHGECMLARECFHEMQRHGLKPDVATFTVVLAACCHAGQVEEGYWFFNAMKEDHGIIPRVEHFNCLIDLLGRAGRLSEASQLLKTMPGFPDIMGWMSLLTACRKYGDAKLGRKCFEEILHIDPDNSAVYTLMSNIYADAHMWDDVARLEKLRTCANAWKKAATAWIQVNDKLHEFMVGERDCPPNDSVNIRLKALKQQMEEEGYVPKLDLVSQQKPVEGSENTLTLVEGSEQAFKLIESSEHAFNAGSKRLLVAFGLSSSLEGATLRPTRVLNMFANYRNVTFITSNAVKKKLILRDLYWSYLSRLEFFIVGLFFSFHYALKRKIGDGLV